MKGTSEAFSAMPMNHALSANEETLSQRLRTAGLKVTRPRLLVLGLLYELEGHHAVDHLVQELERRQTPLPRASVYNVMGALLSRGLVVLADAGPGHAVFEAQRVWHHHFVCLDCGAVIDVPCVKGEKTCLQPAQAPGIVEEAQIIFRGHCTKCLAAMGESGNGGATEG